MKNGDSRWEQLRAMFSAELEERVRALDALLLRLERDADREGTRTETLDALFREAHSLKGAARAVELIPVEQLAHALETALDDVRRHGEQPTRAWFDAASRAVEALNTQSHWAPEALPTSTEFAEVLSAVQALRAETAEDYQDPPPGAARPRNGAARSPRRSRAPEPHRRAIADETSQDAHTVGPIPADGVPAARVSSPAPPAAATAPRLPPASVKVSVAKLDTLLGQAGELAVTQIRIEQRLGQLRELRQELDTWRRDWRTTRGLRLHLRRSIAEHDRADARRPRELEALLRFVEQAEQRSQAVLQKVEAVASQFRGDVTELSVVTHAIQDEVLAVRLTPVGALFGPLDRMVRDLTRDLGKEATLHSKGADIEIDRKILEQLRDPLMHMLRNAVDHGIERPDERQTRGKPRAGTIRLSAAQRGGVIEVELTDDGAGIDPDELRQAAIRKGLLSAEQAAALGPDAARELIFRPGFSTKPAVTDMSGRGVGMDVVRQQVEQLGGQVRVSSTLGQGTRFAITVPLTLATTRALLVEQGSQRFAVPSAFVERTARLRMSQIVLLEGRPTIQLDGHPVPAIELADVLERVRDDAAEVETDSWRPFLVVRQDDLRVALLLDRLVDEQEIVVKSLGWPLRRVRNVSGVAVLGSGHTVVILNPADLVKSALLRFAGNARQAGQAARRADPAPQRRILIVDDSLTTRMLEKSIFESAGYDVLVASDGIEALTLLHSQPPDLVVSDVDMPRMDGFALTAEIRRDSRLRQIPVVLVTSLDATEHRERGVEVGADAYIVKGAFDQGQLLETVGRLI